MHMITSFHHFPDQRGPDLNSTVRGKKIELWKLAIINIRKEWTKLWLLYKQHGCVCRKYERKG